MYSYMYCIIFIYIYIYIHILLTCIYLILYLCSPPASITGNIFKTIPNSCSNSLNNIVKSGKYI